jgi:hypothetical protein
MDILERFDFAEEVLICKVNERSSDCLKRVEVARIVLTEHIQNSNVSDLRSTPAPSQEGPTHLL